MPTWGQILQELKEAQAQTPGKPVNFDAVRRKYLVQLSAYTKRATILYSSRFVNPAGASPDSLSINDEDLQGLMEVVHGVDCKELDLILHSPGGQIDAAEAFVIYLRQKFDHIRVIVPSLAMSAAAMIACSSDRIVMGKHSFLGPFDPQFFFNTALNQRMVSAQTIEEQFELAQKDIKDPSKLGAWIPILSQYGPDILVKCRNATALAKSLVEGWLKEYMLKGDADGNKKAFEIADWLSTHNNFKSHGRHLSRADLEKKGILIDYLENDQTLQDLVLSVFHATNHMFAGTLSVKIIENHLGHAFVKHLKPPQTPIGLQIPLQLPAQIIQPPKQNPPTPLPPPAAATIG